jgi:hypothetical protein
MRSPQSCASFLILSYMLGLLWNRDIQEIKINSRFLIHIFYLKKIMKQKIPSLIFIPQFEQFIKLSASGRWRTPSSKNLFKILMHDKK